MTDLKKLRELAIGSMVDLPPSPVIRKEDLILAKARIDFCAACHPQAIIEVLDMVDQYREALTTIQTWSSYPNRIFEIGIARAELFKINKMAREALEGEK